MDSFRSVIAACAVFAVMMPFFAGCGDSSVSDLASSVKESVSQGVDKVKGSASDAADSVQEAAVDLQGTVGEALNLAGKLELTLDEPIQTEACYARWISPHQGRPAVLQLQSYRSADQETFPAVMVHAKVRGGDLPSMVGQTVAAEMFVQKEADGAVWSTSSELVQMKINSFQEDVLSGEFVGGAVSGPGGAGSHVAAGVFEAVLQ